VTLLVLHTLLNRLFFFELTILFAEYIIRLTAAFRSCEVPTILFVGSQGGMRLIRQLTVDSDLTLEKVQVRVNKMVSMFQLSYTPVCNGYLAYCRVDSMSHPQPYSCVPAHRHVSPQSHSCLPAYRHVSPQSHSCIPAHRVDSMSHLSHTPVYRLPGLLPKSALSWLFESMPFPR
jgi:hypothetical protein